MSVGIEYDVINQARSTGLRLQMGAPQPWLTTRGHLDPLVQREAPADVLDLLDVIHRALRGDAHALAHQQARPLAVDLVGPHGELIELDELQHFTGERRTSLGWYPLRATVGFSVEQYRSLIELWRARAQSVFTRQWSAGFVFQGGRRAQRAYFDAVRDLLAPTFTGHELVRIPVVDRDPRAAAATVRRRLG